MTRDKALAASKALDNIDGFQIFMEEVDKAVMNAEDWCEMSADFKLELNNLLEAELLRRKQILENL